ncbi:ABC transporter permease subunit [Paenibacillus sp. J5C_2022]|uniref:ABC transporter permease n=1 Tax=Paenibacillus sp. J5C2022 TaxID=2977129 RepID=UPI0021D027E4|nr:ABC transporter permease subunit [Paenibacillus sp. J5C2022]MCU6708421.1 ABC transporter permease subunit [Paenibacillus sp. J5C2022]
MRLRMIDLYKYRYLYLLLLPGVLWYLVYRYFPMVGVIIAFKDYSFVKGIWGSPWAGLKHFHTIFNSPDFYLIVRNTLLINLYSLMFVFTSSIILALLLNELKQMVFKRAIQTIVYFPHFLSWVIFGGLIVQLLSPKEGIINQIIMLFGGEPIYFMTKSEYFRSVITVSSILKEAGWGAIIYLAALAGIDQEQYEAATIDGANRWHKLLYVTLPGIRNTIILMLILRVGYMLDVSFEQIYIMYNPAVYDVADVLSTYIYRMGLQNAQLSMTTAVGLFQAAVGFVLIYMTNQVAKKTSDISLW